LTISIIIYVLLISSLILLAHFYATLFSIDEKSHSFFIKVTRNRFYYFLYDLNIVFSSIEMKNHCLFITSIILCDYLYHSFCDLNIVFLLIEEKSYYLFVTFTILCDCLYHFLCDLNIALSSIKKKSYNCTTMCCFYILNYNICYCEL